MAKKEIATGADITLTGSGTAGATIAFGDLCYLDVTATEWLLADASAAATAGDVILGICVDASTDGAATSMLLMGTVKLMLPHLAGQGITKDDYDKKLKEMKEKQYEINIQVEDHTRADENYYITASNVLNLAKRAKELFISSEIPEKRAILNYLLQNCTANGKKLEYSLRSPYNYILTFANQPTWLRG